VCEHHWPEIFLLNIHARIISRDDIHFSGSLLDFYILAPDDGGLLGVGKK
jgi:hypothetical protein